MASTAASVRAYHAQCALKRPRGADDAPAASPADSLGPVALPFDPSVCPLTRPGRFTARREIPGGAHALPPLCVAHRRVCGVVRCGTLAWCNTKAGAGYYTRTLYACRPYLPIKV